MGHKLTHPQIVPLCMKAPSVQLAILLPSEYNYNLSQTFLPSCMCSIRSHQGYICTSWLNSTNKYSQALEISLSTMFVRMTPSTASIRASYHSSQHLLCMLQEPAASGKYSTYTVPFLTGRKFNSISAGCLVPFGFSVREWSWAHEFTSRDASSKIYILSKIIIKKKVEVCASPKGRQRIKPQSDWPFSP